MVYGTIGPKIPEPSRVSFSCGKDDVRMDLTIPSGAYEEGKREALSIARLVTVYERAKGKARKTIDRAVAEAEQSMETSHA